MLEDVIETHDEVQQELKRITGEHPAVKPANETPYHIAGGAIGNEDDLVLSAPRLTLPSKQTHSEQAPGTGMALPSAAAVADTRGRHGEAIGVQAHPLSAPLPAQADFPPAGSVSVGAPTAQASGFTPPKRPRGKRPPEPLTLMGSKVMQWIGEIRGAKPRMTENNVEACNALAETDGVSKEALAVYFEYADQQKWTISLLEAAGQTGNKRQQFLSFESNWPKLKKKLNGQSSHEPPPKKEGTDFDIYKGNGPEEREQALRDYEQRKADGTLIW